MGNEGDEMAAKVLLNYTEKGGSGKSFLNFISAKIFSDKGLRTLVIDADMQRDGTELFERTYNQGHKFEPEVPFAQGLKNLDLTNSIVKVAKNLDIIPGDSNVDDFFEKSQLPYENKVDILNHLLKPIKNNYDLILIDTNPSLNAPTKAGIKAADGIVIIVMTDYAAYLSSVKTLHYLLSFKKESGAKFKILGALIYLSKKTSSSKIILNKARNYFKDGLLKNQIRYMERVNLLNMKGLNYSLESKWTQKVYQQYGNVAKEVLTKLKEAK